MKCFRRYSMPVFQSFYSGYLELGKYIYNNIFHLVNTNQMLFGRKLNLTFKGEELSEETNQCFYKLKSTCVYILFLFVIFF